MRIAIVGGGIMGRGIALAFARAGHPVTVIEPDASARHAVDDWFALMLEGTSSQRPRVEGELDAVASAQMIIEAAPEDLPLKRELWARLGDIAAADAILATNTSSLDVDDFSTGVPHPGRVVVTHWFNPAYVVECVEVARAAATTPQVIDTVLLLLRSVGRRPVLVPNVRGFIANRIQFAAIREALLCVQEGMDPAVVDEVVRTSFAPRLAALGPLANADLGGLDTYQAVLESLAETHGERFAPPALLDDLVRSGRRGVKSGSGLFSYREGEGQRAGEERDRRLARVIRAAADDQEENKT